MGPRRHRAARAARPARRGRRRARAHGRPVPRRVHRPRPLRRAHRRRRGRQRRHPRAATPRSRWPRPTAGADVVAPVRDDGRPGRRHPRRARRRRPRVDVAILAYAAKYASALYGPFRDAVDVDDRRRRRPQGLPAGPAQRAARRSRRSALDIAEGADMVMVKPALAYLDVIAACPGRGRRAAGRVPRVRRVRDGQGGGRAGLDRRRRRRHASTSPPSSGPAPT